MYNNGSNNSDMGSDGQPYFTPVDSVPSAENLNTNDEAWQNIESRNLGEIGQKAIYSPESTTSEETVEQPVESEPATTEMSMPPGYVEPEIPEAPVQEDSAPTPSIQINSGHVTSTDINAVKASEIELSQTGDAAKFYDQIRGNIVNDGEGQ